jgi:alanine dehydrogenase
MPGAVGRTSTYALCNATLPFVLELANLGLLGAIAKRPEMLSAVNVHHGHVTHRAVAETFGLPFTPFAL